MVELKVYEVGGSVRDKILGRRTNDIDYVVVCGSYEEMRQYVVSTGATIFLETPEYYTIRASHVTFGNVDYVWARKEGPYSDGRRPDWVKPATLYEDLRRRDFRMNAMALDVKTGQVHDPFHGVRDIKNRIVAPVISANESFNADKLRAIRALRFAVTLGFFVSPGIHDWLRLDFNLGGVSDDRVHQELMKMFQHDTTEAFRVLGSYPNVYEQIFNHTGVWLKPTMKKRKGRKNGDNN